MTQTRENGKKSSVWSAEMALAIARQASREMGIEPGEFTLLRFGTNANYRLPGAQLVMRIARPETPFAIPHRELEVAGYLNQAGVPVVEPAEGYEQPILVQDCSVTLWKWVEHAPADAGDAAEFGRLVKRLHAVDPPPGEGLPEWNGLERIAHYLSVIAREPSVADADLELLRGWYRRLAEDWRPAESRLGWGLVHGDAHLGNALRSSDGLVLADFESVAMGPREVDLIPLTVSQRRFGMSLTALNEFLSGYGFQLEDGGDEQFDLACKVRELLTTVWLASTDPRSEELQRRLRYWRGEVPSPQWQAA